MPTATIPDLSTDQLAELSDRMRDAEQQRSSRERAEAGKAQLLRQTRSKLTRVCSEITKTEAEMSDKRQTVHMLKERRDELRKHGSPTADLNARDELAALDTALTWAMDEGIAITAKVHVPSSARPVQLLNDASPHGLNWRTPIAELGRRLEALTAERDRLQTRLSELEEDASAGDLAA